MRTVTRLMALGLLLAVAFGAWRLGSAKATDSVNIRPSVEVTGATPQQLALARWAIARFETAGLKPPVVEIAFHGDASGCRGHLGWARSGRAEVCTVLANEMSRRNLLHEMSHIWLDQNVEEDTQDRFLRARGLVSWNSSRDPWELRGYEQGAEIMAWALGDRILSAQIPNNEPQALEPVFEILTGVALPLLPGDA